MVDLVELTKQLEVALNTNMLGVTFKLFTDTGKYKKAQRKYNEQIDYINGIVTNTASDIQKTNDGLIVATMTNRLEFIIRCKDDEEDVTYEAENQDGEIVDETLSGNETFLSNLRKFLDEFTQENSYKLMIDAENNMFDVSIAYSLAIPGIRNQQPGVGDSMTYVLYAYYNFVQNGENSLNNKFLLDGVQIPYTLATPRRVPTVEMDVYSDTSDGSAKATISNTVWGLTLNCPSFVSEFSATIKNYLLNGERNVIHVLEQISGEISKIYLVFFGDVSTSYQGILNAGQEISFVEAREDYELVSFPSSYTILYCKAIDPESATQSIDSDVPFYVIKYGVDGTITIIKSEQNRVSVNVSVGDYVVCTQSVDYSSLFFDKL